MIDLTELQPVSLTTTWQPTRELPPLPLPYGLYAGAATDHQVHTLWRDPLGCHKLFYGKTAQGQWVAANRIHRLLDAGVPCREIHSCPAGNVLRIEQDAVQMVASYPASATAENAEFTPDALHEKVRVRLADAFTSIANQFPQARFVICLSGGLDSSVIASWAARYLPRPTAFCFTFSDHFTGAATPAEDARVSEDFVGASRIAQALQLPLVPVFRPREAVKSALSEAIVLGQDWRDFNAHCAVINLFLAQSIRAAYPGEQVVVLTGDFMNEYVCDYREEIVDGAVYYQQPKVSLGRRRRFFVKGLDASDRESGVFSAFGLTLVQPFAALADLYLGLPAKYLEWPDIKSQLNGPLLSPQILELVNTVKTRAQVGGKEGGVLGICHRAGIGQNELASIWKNSFGPEQGADALNLIEFGIYRA